MIRCNINIIILIYCSTSIITLLAYFHWTENNSIISKVIKRYKTLRQTSLHNFNKWKNNSVTEFS